MVGRIASIFGWLAVGLTVATAWAEEPAETGFPLEGKHTEAACSGCHPSGKLVDLPMECAGCHVDRHRGKLGDQCTDCHSVEGFKPVDGFDHSV